MTNYTIEATQEGTMEMTEREIQLDSMIADDVVLEWLLQLEEEDAPEAPIPMRAAN